MTEPFIVPGLYQPYANESTPIGDEYDLSLRYIQDGGKANLEKQMRQHYETFITEEDFAMIAAAGLNWVRMPFGFWAIETYSDEPYLEGVAWEYIQRAIGWARKYGIRINLDLHAGEFRLERCDECRQTLREISLLTFLFFLTSILQFLDLKTDTT